MRRSNFSLLTVLLAGICCLFLFVLPRATAQETTGGIEGTVTDPSGAAVPNVHLALTGTTLVGSKETDTDAKGYYHFVNLPPGIYEIRATADGFRNLTRPAVPVDVGQLHSIDLQLQIGAATSTVEVTSEAPVIDVTTTHNITDINQSDIANLPHGTSFQSVLEFAPQVRNEPLAGGAVGPNAAMNTMNGSATGGQSPGSGTNGGAFGFSAAGGADSENSYLVDGQETADAIGGFSHTNVPFSFIQSVEVKQSGIEAEYGGAMGAVMNVITERGGSQYHGSVFSQFSRGSWDGSPSAFPRYDPSFSETPGLAFEPDATPQFYAPKKDGISDNFPGFTLGGPLIPSLRDKLWFFVGFNPDFDDISRTVNWDFPGNSAFPATIGPTTFTSSSHTYYANARLDYAATQKIRLFGAWLYEYERDQGEFLPEPDSVIPGQVNSTSTSPAALFAHTLGNSAPNVTTNVGADITISPSLVATFRWGYNFQNYHDFGMPTNGVIDSFLTSGAGATDNLGNPIPASSSLAQIGGFVSEPNNINDTLFNATHRNQISAEAEWFHSGWRGSHDFKFGYQLQRLSNSLLQHFNEPDIQVVAGAGNFYSPQGPVGIANCTPFVTLYGGCAGQYGYIWLYDIGSSGRATSMDHAFFVQDAWQIVPGLTIDAGVRLEHEYVPAEDQPAGGISKPIQFGWGSKIAPRVGVAWDPLKNGKWKIFGSYGKYYDVMKLNVAISSFGGQYWQNCYYALNTDDLSTILPVFNNASRYCVGPNSASQGNFGSSGTPAGITFLENTNQRTFPITCATCTATEEGVAPGLKPYTEHETVFGIDRQVSKTLAFEARWDRRRLDDAIEDAALYNPLVGETFVIVNPGKGVDSSFNGFYNFLYGSQSGCGPTTFACPPALPVAARSYDGVEFRLTRSMSSHWTGMFSYTYSHLRGNYPGLTSTDISDGGGGRNAPDNSRAFDEPYFYYDAAGQFNNGPLNTDRPNTFKGYGYYELPWLKRFTTNFGIFQFFYQGSPVSSFVDEGYSVAPFTSLYGVPSAQGGAYPTYIEPRGQFLPVTQDPVTGEITVGTPYARRTPWFMQTDLQLAQSFKIAERKTLTFSVTSPNVFNQHSVVAYWESMDTNFSSQFVAPPGSAANCPANAVLGLAAGQCFVGDGPAFYSAATHGYNISQVLNNAAGSTGTNKHMAISSLYGKPLYYQLSRTLMMNVKFDF
jgi:hypothetical protein